jgi:hypothetical protein
MTTLHRIEWMTLAAIVIVPLIAAILANFFRP